VLQGAPEKIQVQLLLANLALQLGDLSPRLDQAIRPRPRRAHALRRKDLRRARAPTLARQRLRTVRAEPVAPVIDDRSVEAQLNGQGACALASLQPFNGLQHELPAVALGLVQGHRYALLVGELSEFTCLASGVHSTTGAPTAPVQANLTRYAAEAQGAFAPNTVRALRADTAVFTAWCQTSGVPALPAASQTVADFIDAMRAAKKRPATIRRYVSSIAHLHRAAELPVPSDSNAVKLALRRMMKGDGAAQQQADGLTRRLVDRALHAGGGRLRDLRNRALLAVAYDTLCRRSELVALLRQDLQAGPHGDGTLLVRRGKTDQEGAGMIRFLAPDTMKLLLDWAGAAESAAPWTRATWRGCSRRWRKAPAFPRSRWRASPATAPAWARRRTWRPATASRCRRSCKPAAGSRRRWSHATPSARSPAAAAPPSWQSCRTGCDGQARRALLLVTGPQSLAQQTLTQQGDPPCSFDVLRPCMCITTKLLRLEIGMTAPSHGDNVVRRRTRAGTLGAGGAGRDGRVVSRSSDDLVRAFVARTGRALARIAERMPRERLVEAVGAETDTDVLFRSLQHAAAIGSEIEATPPDPLTAAFLRGAEMKRALLRAEGGVMSGPELARHLGITPQGLGKKRDKGQVFWLEVGEGCVYPAFQVGPDGLLHGIREVLSAFQQGDHWARVNFMLTGDARLGGQRPLDVLRAGDVAAVVRAAHGYGEHGP